MVPCIIVLGTQKQNKKLRSLAIIIKNPTQKAMTTYGFGHRFHDPKIFKVWDFFSFLIP